MKSFNLTLFLHTSVVVALTDLAAAAVCVLLTLHLGAALGLVGVADMSVQTPALGSVVVGHTRGVGPTLGQVTGVNTPVAVVIPGAGQTVSTVSVSPALVGVLTASSVGVSHISLLTAADGLVVDHLTLGCRSTGPGTRVTALLSETGEVAGTLTVENTLRSAVGRNSDISSQAGTGCDTSLASALGERPTGVSKAGVERNRRSGGSLSP